MNQKALRAKLATLEAQQAARIEAVAELRKEQDWLIEKRQLEIDNLRAQVTITAAP